MQVFIISDGNHSYFKEQIDEHLNAGYKVVPGTFKMTSTDMYTTMGVFLEKKED